MHKHKLNEIEILRAISFLAIVMQHTLACYMYNDNLGTGSALTSAFLLLLIRYGVPMFIFITGLVLFYNHGEEELEYWAFIKKRFGTVFAPYFLWTIIYYVWISLLSGTPAMTSSAILAKIGQHTLAGDAFYHLWFIVMILQFYLIFPLLRKLVLSNRNRPVLFLGICFALYIAYIWCYHNFVPMIYESIHSPVIKTIFDYRDRVFLSWFLYFLLGGVFGLYIAKIKDVLERWSRVTGSIYLLTFGFIFYKMINSAYYNAAGSYIINYQITLPLNLEMILYLTSSLLFLYYLAGTIFVKYPGLTRSLQTVGRYSFGSYFIHPFVLFYLNSFAKAYMTTMNAVVQTIVVFGACSLISLFACFIISKIGIRLGNALVGKVSN